MTPISGPHLRVLAVLLLVVSVGAAPTLAGSSTVGGGAPTAVDDGAPTAVDGASTGPRTVSYENTSNQATPTDVRRRAYGGTGVDVAGAVGVGTDRLESRHAFLTFEERLAAAGDTQARLTVVRQTLADVEQRLARLDARQARLYEAFSNGSLTTRTFLRRLARLNAAGDRQLRLVEQIRTAAVSTGQLSLPVPLQIRFVSLQTELTLLENPVGDRLTAAVTGAGSAQTVYLAAASDGLVAATVDDGTYYRVATLRDQRRPGEPDQFSSSIIAARDRAAELYPWVFANSISVNLDGLAGTSIYRIETAHPQGDLRTYLDGATRSVFYEVQSKSPGNVPVTGTATNTTDGLSVTVAATQPTGPMRVTVSDTTGGDVDATVRVDGTRVGRTGADGQLWTVQPDDSARVNATTDTGSVTVRIP